TMLEVHDFRSVVSYKRRRLKLEIGNGAVPAVSTRPFVSCPLSRNTVIAQMELTVAAASIHRVRPKQEPENQSQRKEEKNCKSHEKRRFSPAPASATQALTVRMGKIRKRH